MTGEQVLERLTECYAIIRDSHVVLTPKEDPPRSGQYRHFHSDGYVWKDRVYEVAWVYAELAEEIAERVLEFRLVPEFVVGPAMGAIALANHVAYFLGRDSWTVLAAYAEKKPGGGFQITRGFPRLMAGKTVLVVEDIAVWGTTIRDTVIAVREAGGNPILAFAICAREQVDAGGVLFRSLCKVSGMNLWPEEECPLCKDSEWGPNSVRLDVNSHGLEFLKRKGLI